MFALILRILVPNASTSLNDDAVQSVDARDTLAVAEAIAAARNTLRAMGRVARSNRYMSELGRRCCQDCAVRGPPKVLDFSFNRFLLLLHGLQFTDPIALRLLSLGRYRQGRPACPLGPFRLNGSHQDCSGPLLVTHGSGLEQIDVWPDPLVWAEYENLRKSAFQMRGRRWVRLGLWRLYGAQHDCSLNSVADLCPDDTVRGRSTQQ